MKRLLKNIGEGTYNFINNGGWLSCLVLAGCALIGCLIYTVCWFKLYGFEWGYFIGYLALWAFVIWALCVGVVKPIVKHPDAFKLKECDKVSDMFKK